MNYFVNTNTNVYPYFLEKLSNDYPEYNVYQPLPEGIFPVIWLDQPEDSDPSHKYTLEYPIEINGVWTTNWVMTVREPGTYTTGPGPWSFDEKSQTWHLSHPLAKATHD